MRYLLLAILFLVTTHSKALELSSNAEISLLTCSPGSEAYTSFGHSAFRIKDDSNYVDWVFNYGTFDFDTEHFMWKFVRGKLMYFLNVEKFNLFKEVYKREDRSIYEQILNLNHPQKQKLAEFLLNNAQNENRYYLYDFLFNNCSSILRDIAQDEFNAAVVFNKNTPEITFRQLLDNYMRDAEWSDFGIDLMLGSTVDKKAHYEDRMFLPFQLYDAFDNATINGQPLVKSRSTLLKMSDKPYKDPLPINPAPLFWTLLTLALFLKIYLTNPFIKDLIPTIFILTSGLIGMILLFMQFFTDHQSCYNNLNLLWAWPTHLFMAFTLFIKNKPKWVVSYWKIAKVIIVLLLIFWGLNPQTYHIAILPYLLICLLGISSKMPVFR